MENDQLEPIAIIGISLKFPEDAVSSEAFWKMLCEGRSVSSKVPADRFNVDAYYHPDPARLDSIRVTHGHFLKEDPRAFDAPFFNMSPAEASVLDPQQRCLLEGAYHTFENAGLPMTTIAGSNTSVYSASFGRDAEAIICRDTEFRSSYYATSSGSSMLSNRISYFYDLHGPSVTVDTACSSGLIAFHLACQSLWTGSAEQSLVCGSNTYITPECMSHLDNAGFLSPDGRCHSFGHTANGYARGEGFGFVLLKPLKQALADGHVIRAIVRSAGSNQDGRTPSITAPSSTAQIELIKKTYAAGGLDLSTTDYVEAHGTGTIVGDPTEAGAIGQVFRQHRERPLHIGSVKANIGHLEGASGLAGLLKTVLVLEHGVIPPIAGLEKVNPAIDAAALRLQFNKEPVAWPHSTIRRASVSSFGYGGSNAHVVLEDAYNYLRLRGLTGLHKTSPTPDLKPFTPAVTLGAANAVLQSYGDEYSSGHSDGHSNGYPHKRINGHGNHHADREVNGCANGHTSGHVNGPTDGYKSRHNNENAIDDARSNDSHQANTYANCQSHYKNDKIASEISPLSETEPFLFVVSAADPDGPKRQARALDDHLISRQPKKKNKDYFVDVTHTLYSHRTVLGWRAFSVVYPEDVSPVYGALSDARFSIPSKRPILRFVFSGQGTQVARMGIDLTKYAVVRRSFEDCDAYLRSLGCKWSVFDELHKVAGESQVGRPALSQPLCTAVQVALVELLREWNIQPSSVCGHSSGEIAAAFCAGALTRKNAWSVAYYRGLFAENLLQQRQSAPMAMMSVGLSEQDVAAYLTGDESPDLACINSPSNVTLSGTAKCIDDLAATFDRNGVFARKLDVSLAYHSKKMKAISAAYLESIKDLRQSALALQPDLQARPATALFSSVTGAVITAREMAEPEYWVSNLVSPVRFADALTAMVSLDEKQSGHFVLEVAPQPALRRPVLDTLDLRLGKDRYKYASTLQGKGDDLKAMLELAGSLWTHGFNVDINSVNVVDGRTQPKRLADLPAYPFNRSTEYWSESRLSKNVSYRPFRRHNLLGLRSRDWNVSEASWRNIIRTPENPWILDHGLNGSKIYPGSGMLVMAIEAARQLCDNLSQNIMGYRLKNVHFMKAIDVDDSDQGTEASIYMRARDSAHNDTNPGSAQVWYDWRVFRINGTAWSECAYGSIGVELKDTTSSDTTQCREQRRAATVQATHRDITSKCSLSVYHEKFYENLSTKSGFDYGPHFALLRELMYDKSGHASATLSLRDYAETIPFADEDKCVVHPTTLDVIGHLHIVALSRGGWQPIPTQMFSSVKEMWISQKLLSLPGNPSMRVSTDQTFRGLRESEFSARALLADNLEPVVIATGLRMTAITSLSESASDDGTSSMCYGIQYQPDLSLLSPQETGNYLQRLFAAHPSFYAPAALNNVDRGDTMSWHYMTTTAKRLREEGPHKFEGHLNRYTTWLWDAMDRGDIFSLEDRGLSGDLNIQQVIDEANTPLQLLIKKVGERLYDILSGKVPPLEVIFGGSIADDFYHSDVFMGSYRKIGSYLQILSHANPKLKIIECGGGTASATAQIVPALMRDCGNGKQSTNFTEYAFTDISSGFFENARERFPEAENNMRFQKFDLEVDPAEQGWEYGTYDVAVAANCLHATSDIVRALENVRKILKPGGKLILVEITNVEIVSHGFIFGLVPGWWLREEEWWDSGKNTNHGPLLTREQWNRVLPIAGFSEVDLVFRESSDSIYDRTSVLVATASPPKKPNISAESCVIVADPTSEEQTKIAERLKEMLLPKASICSIDSVGHHIRPEVFAISLVDLEEPIFLNPTDETLNAISHMAMVPRRLLWVSSGYSPYGELALGVGRTVNSEKGEDSFVTLILDRTSAQVKRSVETIGRVLAGLIRTSSNKQETEYVERGGLVQIRRVAPSSQLNEMMHSRLPQKNVVPYFVGQSGKPRFQLTIDMPGLLDTFFYEEIEEEVPVLPDNAVQIDIYATGLGERDMLVALGQIPGEGFGFEGAGVVIKAGKATSDEFTIGSRVLFYTSKGGCLGTSQVLSDAQVLKIPDELQFHLAAALPVSYGTVIYSLDYVARIKKNDSILIFNGLSDVGQPAIQLAKLRGARIFTTTNNEVEKEVLQKVCGLPGSHIISSASVGDAINALTNNRGVDIVLNQDGGAVMYDALQCIAPCGHFIHLGKSDILADRHLYMAQFDKNITFAAVDILVLIAERPQAMKSIMKDALSLLQTHPDLLQHDYVREMPASKVQETFNILRSHNFGAGKQVINFTTPNDELYYRPAIKATYMLFDNVTYVITGGFGGLGKEIVRWMVQRGAKHFVLLSRSGEASPDAAMFICELRGCGATVYAPACDVGDKQVLEKTLAYVAANMPPIRGCIHGAMVLQDSLFMKMTARSFQTPLGPKVVGSWNLHELLPSNVDFFIMLSSFAGIIGDAGQSNYAAGNTFEDALANYRASKGLKGVSIDLSLVAEAGWANENYQHLGDDVKGHKGLRLDDIMILLDALCDPAYDCGQPGATQIIPMQDSPDDLYKSGTAGKLTWIFKPLFSILQQMGETGQGHAGTSSGNDQDEIDYVALVHAAAEPTVAGEFVAQGLIQKLARSLSLPAETLDMEQPAHALGVDSLIAVQIRHWLFKVLQTDIPVFMILKDQSLRDLCLAIATKMLASRDSD